MHGNLREGFLPLGLGASGSWVSHPCCPAANTGSHGYVQPMCFWWEPVPIPSEVPDARAAPGWGQGMGNPLIACTQSNLTQGGVKDKDNRKLLTAIEELQGLN